MQSYDLDVKKGAKPDIVRLPEDPKERAILQEHTEMMGYDPNEDPNDPTGGIVQYPIGLIVEYLSLENQWILAKVRRRRAKFAVIVVVVVIVCCGVEEDRSRGVMSVSFSVPVLYTRRTIRPHKSL